VSPGEERGAAPSRLSLVRVLSSTFTLSWQHRADVARTVAIPLLAVIGCTLAWDLAAMNVSKTGRWTFLGIYLVANCWLASVTQRMVLMEQPGKPTHFDKAAWQRLFMFVAVVAALWALYTAMKLGIRTALNVSKEFPIPSKVVDAVATWLPFLLIGRFSLLLPAVATGERFQPAKAWRDSVGNSWRLAVVVGALPSLLDFLVDLLYRNGATAFEFGLLVVLSALCTVLEVVALSLAYQALTSNLTAPAPPPTDPPA
jgi:Flp pilus assembly pilin Flp